jgi:hypothetical protein
MLYMRHFARFADRQRRNVYMGLTEVQKSRWDSFMSAGLNPKVLKELIYEVVGTKPNEELVRVFRTISKVYCG